MLTKWPLTVRMHFFSVNHVYYWNQLFRMKRCKMSGFFAERRRLTIFNEGRTKNAKSHKHNQLQIHIFMT